MSPLAALLPPPSEAARGPWAPLCGSERVRTQVIELSGLSVTLPAPSGEPPFLGEGLLLFSPSPVSL